MGLIFEQKNSLPKNLSLYSLNSYLDNIFTSNPKDCKLVMDYYFFLNSAVIFWNSKK